MPKCDQSRIRQFLQYELSRAEQHQFEQHLESCDTCCHHLHDATAEAAWWEETSRFLPDQSDDLRPLTEITGIPTDTDAPPRQQGSDDISIPDETSIPAAVHNVLRLLAPSDDPQMLGRIGTYEVAGVVGAGGMSVVLKAFDASLSRYVAIKVLAPHLATSGAARKRFAREAQAAAAIVHENVIAIHGVDEALGLPYLVMPYVRGDSLQKRLDAEGPLELKEILRIAKQTAAGLSAAHTQGLIHRDVKPANILLADGVERVTITDFGLARAADDASLTRTGTIAGTPQYMSPEQARGETVDQRTDLFSLGSVIYAMCTGRAPFRAESTYGVLRRISDAYPRPITDINCEIPDWLGKLVARLHAKSPQDRYASALDVAADLEQCLAYVQQPSRESLPPGLAESTLQRLVAEHRLAVGGMLAVAALIVMMAGWHFRTLLTSGQRPSDANRSQIAGQASDGPPNAPNAGADEAVADAEVMDWLDRHPSAAPEDSYTAGSGGLEWADGTDLELHELERDTGWLETQLDLEAVDESVEGGL